MDALYVYIAQKSTWQAEADGNPQKTVSNDAVFSTAQGANNFSKTSLHRTIRMYRPGEILKREENEQPKLHTGDELEYNPKVGKEKLEMLYYGMVGLREKLYAPFQIELEVKRMILRSDVPVLADDLMQDTTMNDEGSSSEENEDAEDTNTSESSESDIKPHMRTDPQAERSTCLVGMTFAFTGRPHKLDRAEEMSMVHRHGGIMVRLGEAKKVSYLVRSAVGNGRSVEDEEMIEKLRPVVVDKVGLKTLINERMEGKRNEEVGRKRRRIV